jgi:hypothetical protein
MKQVFVVSRIEGAKAILETEKGDSFIFPAGLLPQPVEEGMHLRFSIEIDTESQAATEDRIRSVRDKLRNP